MNICKTILLLALTGMSMALTAAIPASERQALIDLYNATDGDHWIRNIGWKTAPLAGDGFAMPGTENTWYGIEPDNANTTVMGINFGASNNLKGSIPASLGNLGHLQQLNLNTNHLSGAIPVSLCNLRQLKFLDLSGNQLSGSVPAEIGNLTNLSYLYLSGNKLSGAIPPSLANLYLFWMNENSKLRFDYNALYVSDQILIDFFFKIARFEDSTILGWDQTQTIDPGVLSAIVTGPTAITLSWSPIVYTGDTGGYRVFYSTVSGGPYTFYAQTSDKTVSSQLVNGLTPGRTYYFVIQTRTNPSQHNQNTVDSEYSVEVSATTGTAAALYISGQVTRNGSGVANVVMNGLPGNPLTNDSGFYSALINSGFSGTVTPILTGYTFTPANRTYTNVASNQITQNYAANGQPSAFTISGQITLNGMGLAGVVLRGLPANPVTDNSGMYSARVNSGFSATVIPSLIGYIFAPATITYTNVAADIVTNYTASAQPEHVRFTAAAHGKLSGDLDQTIPYGGATTPVLASAEPGYHFNGWSGNGGFFSLDNPLTIAGVWYDMTIEPSFVKNNTGGTLTIIQPAAGSTVKGIVSVIAEASANVTNFRIEAEPISQTKIARTLKPLPHAMSATVAVKDAPDNMIHIPVTALDRQAASVRCSADWDTRNMLFGSYTLHVFGDASSGEVLTDEAQVYVDNIAMHLEAQRIYEPAWLPHPHFIVLHLVADITPGVVVTRFVIYRQENNQDPLPIKEFSQTEIHHGMYDYIDIAIHENSRYSYYIVALDSAGTIIGRSNEVIN